MCLGSEAREAAESAAARPRLRAAERGFLQELGKLMSTLNDSHKASLYFVWPCGDSAIVVITESILE